MNFVKYNLMATIGLMSFLSHAEVVIDCKSEMGEQVNLEVKIDLSEESSIDYLTYSLKEGGVETIFFNQHEKGSISKTIQGGVLVSNFFSESSKQENGKITNAGIIILTATGEPKKMSGLIGANGGIYPLACTLTGILAQRFPNPPVVPPQSTVQSILLPLRYK